MEWYYSNNGQQAGPVSQEQLAELYRNGTLKPYDLVWNESMAEWTPIGRAPGFETSGPPSAATSEAPPSVASVPSYTAPAAVVASTGPGLAPSGMNEPPTYLWQSIVIMVLCCMPLGIPALIFSTKVKPAVASGNYTAALEASKKAKLFCILGLVIGFVVQVIYIGINIAMVMEQQG